MWRWVMVVGLCLSLIQDWGLTAQAITTPTAESSQIDETTKQSESQAAVSSSAADLSSHVESSSSSESQVSSSSASSVESHAGRESSSESSVSQNSAVSSSRELQETSSSSSKTGSEHSSDSSVSTSGESTSSSSSEPSVVAEGGSDTATSHANDAMPNAVVDTSVDIIDAHGQEVSAGSVLGDHSELTYRFKFKHRTGTATAKKVKLYFRAPEAITFRSAEFLSSQGVPETISVDKKRLLYELPIKLSDQDDWAMVEVKVIANHVKDNIIVGNKKDDGEAKYYIGSHDHNLVLPRYMLLADLPMHLELAKTEFRIKHHEKLKLTGTIKRESSMEDHNVRIMVVRKGDRLASLKLNDEEIATGKFEFDLDEKNLKPGTHELEVFSIDRHNMTSQKLSVSVHVQGNLAFKKVPDQVKFKDVVLNGHSQLTERTDDWQVKVNDERGDVKQSWRLLAAVTPFKDPKKGELAGQLEYHQGQNAVPLTSKGTVIATAQGQAAFDSNQAWKNDTGILLKTRPDAVPGTYQGKITWTLEDVPSDQ
ncbi:hypothetical protein ACFP3T_12405 [Lactiplantibacillus dongliensis]|uniref:Cell surface protein n=1 Tax=Lactiplantibacillus dongliensis TaxID=2559919 RepID=A0ABW1R8I1_9LACO|nr:hypothetical protein [Lactiplantibacillus dongliensis]